MALWKRLRRSWQDAAQTWQLIEKAPIPLSAGKIWLADKDGNARRAMAFTWPVLKRREPGTYRQWMVRVHGARQPPTEPPKQTAGD